MITISGNLLSLDSLSSEYFDDSISKKILNILSESSESYEYSSLNDLRFELAMRKNIIAAAREFDRSAIKFKTFKESTCNKDYWERTEEGGFLLKENVTPSEGIRDFFINARKYGTECSTAIIIIYYIALLNIYPEELFNAIFKNIHLMNWHYIDSDLDVYSEKKNTDFLPGDCRYFKNPDFDEKETEWQGENAIDLGNETYFGHGIGISKKEGIIKSLNKHRNRDSNTSAFLTSHVTLPNFKRLSHIYIKYNYRKQLDYYRFYYSNCNYMQSRY